MKILLTNDDGYAAPGIQVLYAALRQYHKVVLIAPDREKSAVSHGITLNDPIRMSPVRLNDGDDGYAVAGTPADCVKLGLFDLFTTPPDLIISGINPGCNAGVDINYSGTVSAAREGALNGILSLAVSIKTGKTLDFKGMSRFIVNIVDKVYYNGLPSGTFLNINAPDIPFDEVRGVKITRQSSNNLSKQFDKRVDPKNRSYYWYGRIDQVADEPDSDITAILQNYISITPVQCDITNYSVLSELEPFQLP
ncbi:5'/3'-nucleotidase SurE [Desulfobacula toluolica]|uniref:5'-nucleotidase SurE n=1 Tax=Desulfobacula toluolica (strain DSM 7467 / Tol2) TaxID=651182 RepID=K0N612_DESTT|nr:5'/3'-nucleotidase SurE [Desulfobacula toluolica]CCK79469.1 SurE: 5?-nucleotidase [Desulfobacula toluolica Tol2]